MFNKKLIVLIIIFSYNLVFPFSSFFNISTLEESNNFYIITDKLIKNLQLKKVEQEELLYKFKIDLEDIKSLINNYKKNNNLSDNNFNTDKYLSILLDSENTLKEIINVINSIVSILDCNINLLKEYKQDPEFKNKNLTIINKSLYSIDDLQKITNNLIEYNNELNDLKDRLKKTSYDLDNRKKTQQIAKQDYEEKLKEQKDLKAKVKSENIIDNQNDLTKEIEIFDAQESLLNYKKELANLRVLESEFKILYIEDQIKVLNSQIDIIKNEYKKVKNELRITDSDVQKAISETKKKSEILSKKQNELNSKLDALEILKNSEVSKLESLKAKYSLNESELKVIYNWNLEPTSLSSWEALISIARIYNNIKYGLDISKNNILAQIDQEKLKFQEVEINQLIHQSWYKLTHVNLFSNYVNEISKDIKEYEKLKVDIQMQISETAEKRAFVSQELNNNTKLIDALKEKIFLLKEQRNSIFKDHINLYNRYHVILKDELYEDSGRRGELLAQLIELYQTNNNIRALLIKKIDSIIYELKLNTNLVVSSIFINELKQFIPDSKKFFNYIFNYNNLLKSLSYIKEYLIFLIIDFENTPLKLFIFFIKVFIVFLFFLLIKLYLPDLTNALEFTSFKFKIVYIISIFINSILSFININLGALFIWLMIMLASHYRIIFDNYLSSLFYLLSIPFWLYYANRFIKFIHSLGYNKNYIFTSQEYYKRFIFVFSIFLYLSIFILLFRESFIEAKLGKSEIPTLFLSLNFIIFQICLISLIKKNQILSLIPRSNDIWNLIYENTKKYYFLFLSFLVIIIIMSNPYLGYGPQFFSIISRIFFIIILIPIFSAIHMQIKRLSGSLFFYLDDENIKERFDYARTAYGLFVIISFIFLIILGSLIAINVLGYEVGFSNLLDVLYKQIYSFKDLNTGRDIPVSAISILYVILYLVIGIIFAYLLNKFALEKMFDLLLINPGVQNAILSFIKYLIIIISIILGLQSIGFSSSILYIFAVIGGLGVAGKEIITDFIGYFIILIQRHIKIGDLIQIDNETNLGPGIVRNITLRSVVLRCKNSVTVIVPNSHIMTKVVTNWNYSPTYFAFEDIFITIPYNYDPEIIKNIIFQILDRNINILKNPSPIIRLNDFSQSGFLFLIRGFLSPDKVVEQFDIVSEIRFDIVKALRQNNIEIAYPTRYIKFLEHKE